MKLKTFKIIIYSQQYENTDPEYYVITEQYIKNANAFYINLYLAITPFEGLNVIWLMDGKQHGPYQSVNSNVVVILFASFSDRNYKNFKNHSMGSAPTMMYLPWWSQTDAGKLVGLDAECETDASVPNSAANGRQLTSDTASNIFDHEFEQLVFLYCKNDKTKYSQYAACCNIAGPNPRNVFAN